MVSRPSRQKCSRGSSAAGKTARQLFDTWIWSKTGLICPVFLWTERNEPFSVSPVFVCLAWLCFVWATWHGGVRCWIHSWEVVGSTPTHSISGSIVRASVTKQHSVLAKWLWCATGMVTMRMAESNGWHCTYCRVFIQVTSRFNCPETRLTSGSLAHAPVSSVGLHTKSHIMLIRHFIFGTFEEIHAVKPAALLWFTRMSKWFLSHLVASGQSKYGLRLTAGWLSYAPWG